MAAQLLAQDSALQTAKFDHYYYRKSLQQNNKASEQKADEEEECEGCEEEIDV